MNVEKLQKINALASELKKHHFASRNDEAYTQAERVYEAHKAEQKEEPKSIRIENGLEEKKLQLLLEMNNKKFEAELERMRTVINQLIAEINQLKQSKPSHQEQPKEKQQALKTEEKIKHPRQGDFTSSDVDIQKMFYFGNKH